MKNVQIVDGADNATFSIFRATESEFEYLFPNDGQDIEIVEDFFARHHEKFATETLNNLWLRPIHKSKVNGIDGTLYYNHADKRRHIPASKREIDREASQINASERELYARLREKSSTTPDTILPATTPELLSDVPGGSELLDWFDGHVPSFHDAEVLTLALDRDASRCDMRIHAFEMTSEVDAEGYFVLGKHVIVSFRFEGVTNLELNDFNHQNVITELSLSRTAENDLRLELLQCYGLFGFIEARKVMIALEPGRPAKGVYAT
jgi:hypothetical protein